MHLCNKGCPGESRPQRAYPQQQQHSLAQLCANKTAQVRAHSQGLTHSNSNIALRNFGHIISKGLTGLPIKDRAALRSFVQCSPLLKQAVEKLPVQSIPPALRVRIIFL